MLDCSASIGIGGLRRLLLEVRSEAAALDHEAADHAVELRAVVMLGFHVVEKIRDRFRRGVGIELDADLARGRVEFDLRVGGERGQGEAAATAVTAIRNGRRNIGLLLEGWNGTEGKVSATTSAWPARLREQIAHQRELRRRGLVVAIELRGAIVFGRGETRVDVAEVLARDRPVGGGANRDFERDRALSYSPFCA